MSNNLELEVYREGMPETPTFAGGLNFVSRVAIDGMLRVVDRLNLAGLNIPVTTIPVGGRAGANDLFGMFDKARQGFRLLFQMDSYKSGKIDPTRFLRKVGISTEDEATRFINGLFPSRAMVEPNYGFSLSVALAFAMTLRNLAQAETVNFYYLGITPADDDTGLMLHPSFWKYNITPETVWGTIGIVEAIVRQAVLQRGSVENPDRLYKAAHFLAAISSLRKAG
ncbi:hypothetical protein HYS96_04890 [Candidatus Daviesbacteria bacterium]|nr:hypothetical protein [Candidatus Daviesbacteria bacterium]